MDVSELLDVLDLAQVGERNYIGQNLDYGARRVFGGQVVAQALVAAQRTVGSHRHPHSLHAYFLRPGDPAHPILFGVDLITDGRTFTMRRVTACQHERPIFTMNASFQVDETGLDHQMEMPGQIPPPETLPTQQQQIHAAQEVVPEKVKRFWHVDRPVEVRPLSIKQYVSRERQEPRQSVWMRVSGSLPKDRGVQSAILAYLSDLTILGVTTFAHGRSALDDDIQSASLNHAIWFHRMPDLGKWLLYVQDSPSTAEARGFARGLIYSEDGVLLASVAQEGLLRLASGPQSE